MHELAALRLCLARLLQVRLYGVTAHYPGFVMEFVKLGSLKRMRRMYPATFTTLFVTRVLSGITNALVYLHSKSIVHFGASRDALALAFC